MWLDSTNKSLEVSLSGAVTSAELPWTVAFGEVANDNSASAPKGAEGQTNGATPVTLVGTPGLNLVRELFHCTLFNEDTADATVRVRLNNGGTRRTLLQVTLQPGETLTYESHAGWRVLTPDGALVVTTGGSSGAGLPAGSVAAFAGSTVPTGWLDCDGASLLRADFPDLFGAIGTTWGAVDGTHFSLPDFRGRAIIGAGTGPGLTARALGGTSGEETHLLTVAELAQHDHSIGDPGHSHGVTDPGHTHSSNTGVFLVSGTGTPFATAGTDTGDQAATTGSATTDLTVDTAAAGISITDLAGADTPHNNMPPWGAAHWVIKT